MTKKHNKKFGRKNAIKMTDDTVTFDSMGAAKRCYGEGKSKGK